jgi:ATP-dependent Clp protease ATP-binding subunit ClpB
MSFLFNRRIVSLTVEALGSAGRRIDMGRFIPLDTTRTGRKLEELESKLRSLVVGQDEPIHEIVTAYQSHVTGLSPAGRPIGNFLFLGPTGTGKTRIVEAIAQSLLNSPRAMIKIDCGEYQHGHEVAKLVGSPPGYLGHRETHPLLSQEELNRHHTDKVKLSLVLFDEIEKASDTLWNLLLGILDKGVLTLGDNRKVDFSASMIFLTSNLGAREMCALDSPRLGFSPARNGGAFEDGHETRMSRIGVAAVRRRFTPEFINRLDRIVVFKPLGREALEKILDIELELVQERLQTAAQGETFYLNIAESARKLLLREGTDARYGARHLKRAMERLLVQPLANVVASGQIRRGEAIHVSCEDNATSLSFFREATVRDNWRIASSIAA